MRMCTISYLAVILRKCLNGGIRLGASRFLAENLITARFLHDILQLPVQPDPRAKCHEYDPISERRGITSFDAKKNES